jgi:hypothetical protein
MDLPRYGLRSMMHEACANFSGGRFPVRVVDRAGPVVAGRPAWPSLELWQRRVMQAAHLILTNY